MKWAGQVALITVVGQRRAGRAVGLPAAGDVIRVLPSQQAVMHDAPVVLGIRWPGSGATPPEPSVKSLRSGISSPRSRCQFPQIGASKAGGLPSLVGLTCVGKSPDAAYNRKAKPGGPRLAFGALAGLVRSGAPVPVGTCLSIRCFCHGFERTLGGAGLLWGWS